MVEFNERKSSKDNIGINNVVISYVGFEFKECESFQQNDVIFLVFGYIKKSSPVPFEECENSLGYFVTVMRCNVSQ